MGFTQYFSTDEEDPQPMSFEEVRAGVEAIRAVAERRRHEFRIDILGETEILVNAIRQGNRVESLLFRPILQEGGYVVAFGSCKTNEEPEDEGIAEMLQALRKAANHMLVVWTS